MPEAVIQTHELTKEYRHPFFWWSLRARAVTDLTLTIHKGEVFGLLGPNGSGKSTTLKLLLGLIFPTSGQAAIFGRRPNDLAIKSRIGFLPEESYLYRFLTAEETLDFYGRLFGLRRAERRRRTDALLELTGLYHERHRPIVEFSKGMQRRIGLAQSLINDPELIILDEPTTGMDPIGTREIKDLILQLKEKGKTVLISSHVLADVEDVCDRVAILYGGRMQAIGPIQELLRQERLTQITAEMDKATVAAVQKLIRNREGKDTEIKISPPVERLESFFLRVVREAQEKKLATSGVGATTKTLDFLTVTEKEKTVLEQLTAAEESAPEPAKLAHDVESAGAREREVLAQLAGEGEATASPPAQKPAVKPVEELKREANQSVLDRLREGE